VFQLEWTPKAKETFNELMEKAKVSLESRKASKHKKATKDEGLFKQVNKCIKLLANNPRHPGLQTHEYQSMVNPYDKKQKVFEAYAQNKTPSAYRVFWCYGPSQGKITIIAITPQP